ncbi:tyrosine-type recombinase/integrase [Nonomuraea sp. NPDC049655]|uniref:tyrosine-type recombinase/integrase n=1 Tax=Nonomuraea sp. NPDC049655 TaxID=3364355 RepID=UPI0037984E1D
MGLSAAQPRPRKTAPPGLHQDHRLRRLAAAPGLCVTALKHRRWVQEGARKEAGDKWKDSELVFTTRYDTPVEPRNFNHSFELRGNAAGVPRIRVHDTRHTCASMLAALGVHPRVAMRILRHSQISVTMNVYTQIASPETRKALAQLNASLDL